MASTNDPGAAPAVAAGTKVAIVMGSDSDLPIMQKCLDTLREFGVPAAIHVMSAHRSPRAVAEYATRAAERGLEVLICAAGGAAHLAGVVAAHTALPVLGVPMPSKYLSGKDSLYSTVQMPAGIPVATFAIGEPGAANAGLFAVQILARNDARLRAKLAAHKEKLAQGVRDKDAALQAAAKKHA
ncbi:MAG: 5-(carboxyamino)imidazole ribonucleotide mutase [Planctomycetota bacterium]|nr:5-(carboxyamino)imidazole ribonucleotide mutase [Planctomycetota bacterium]